MLSKNVIRYGLGATLCVGLLAACDNRGVTPFKAKSWTTEERAENLRLNGGAGQGGPENVTPRPATGGGDLPALANGDSPLVESVPLAQPTKEGAVDAGGAQSRFPVEFMKREEAQRKASNYDKLMNVVNEALAKDPQGTSDAAALVPAFSADLNSRPGYISIKAALNLGNSASYLIANQATVHEIADGKILPLAIELHDSPTFDKAKEVGNSVYAFAIYSPTSKDTAYVMLDMKHVTNVRKIAVFVYQKIDGKYKLINANVKVEEFKDLVVAGDKAVDKTEDGGGTSAAPKNDRGQQAGGETKSEDKGGNTPANESGGKTPDESKSNPTPDESKPTEQKPANDGKQGAADQPAAVQKAALNPLELTKPVTSDKRLLGRTLDVTQRGQAPTTRTNLVDLSMNKNTPVTFKPKSAANEKSIVAQQADASKIAKAAPAKIDVTQVVKRPQLTMNNVDMIPQSKVAAAPAAKPAGRPSLTIDKQVVLANTADTTTVSRARPRGERRAEIREAARKAGEKAAQLKSAEAK